MHSWAIALVSCDSRASETAATRITGGSDIAKHARRVSQYRSPQRRVLPSDAPSPAARRSSADGVPLHATGVGRGRHDARLRVAMDRAELTLAPRTVDRDVMPSGPQRRDDVVAVPGLDDQAPGLGAARIERAGKRRRMPGGRVDRTLEIGSRAHRLAASGGEEEVEAPLVLLVAAGSAEGHDRYAVTQCEGRRECRTRPTARRQGARQAGLQPG